MEKLYRFPANKEAAALDLGEQIDKMAEELAEVKAAFVACEGEARIIEELWDFIQAGEGALRKFHERDVERGRLGVFLKCKQRGNYSAETGYSMGDSWQQIEADARKNAVEYFNCIGYFCENCPAVFSDGRKPYEHYGVNSCMYAKCCDLVARCKQLALEEVL